jgi:hypothetical protein
MGQTLATAAQWTSASQDGGVGKLELTTANEAILNRIVGFVSGFSASHSAEAKVTFKQPLTWMSEISPSEFTSGYVQNDNEITSEAMDRRKQPLVVMRKKGDSWELSVSSFEYVEKVLHTAGSKKITETRLCLEANRDPLAKILGERFATISGSDDSAYRFIDEIMRSAPATARGSTTAAGEDGVAEAGSGGGGALEEEMDEKKMELKLLLLIKDFDDKLMQEAIKVISTEVKLSPADVDRMYELIKKFTGPDSEKHVLKHIEWLEPYTLVFNNGCRAPFWRQLKGDISYIIATAHDDTEPIYITASTQGCFVNGGPKGTDLDFEKYSETVYRDLIVLLRDKSKHFEQLIDRQEIFKEAERDDSFDNYSSFDVDETQGQDSDSGAGGHGGRSRQHRMAREQSKANRKKKSEEGGKKQQKKLEPSMKWKALALDEEPAERAKMKSAEKPRRMKSSGLKSGKPTYRSDGESSFEESSSESEDEDEVPDRRQEAAADLPSEFWQIQKLVKYLKGGNQTATIIALCSLRDFNLQQENCQMAIRDVGGLEILINLLETDEIKCKIGALKILKEITTNALIRRTITDLGGLKTMVSILREQNKELKCLAAETIANIAHLRRARRSIRQHGGIKNLVSLLDCSGVTPSEVARSGALALWSCSKSERNKLAMRRAGAIPLLAKLLKSPKHEMLIPVVGTLQECASDPSYRLAIRTEGMIEDLVRNLRSNNAELQMHCASAIFKCAEEKETRDLIRHFHGLEPLIALISKTDNKELLAAATGAIWKCSISPENVVIFQKLKTVDLLVGLLGEPEEVLINVVGALAELAKDPTCRLSLRKANGIPPLINLLTGTNAALLINVTKAVGQCASEPDNMSIIDRLDGVRLLWSLLKNPNTGVQASAAWAICPCIENAKDSGEMVRSFVGGLELVVSLLKSDDVEVLSAICAAIACIASDEENLAVITDHGVVPMLAHLTATPEDALRRQLAEAIARCCNWGNNRVTFGTEGAVHPLVRYLHRKDPMMHRSTARALHQLSKDPDNCIAMHEAGVVKPLLDLVGSTDSILQEAAAGCLSNIRRLALANEKARKL